MPVDQCFSTFLLPWNLTQACRSLTEPYELIRESSDVLYARMKLQGVYELISLAGHWGQSRHEDDKADKDDQYVIWPCISRQQYVIVFN